MYLSVISLLGNVFLDRLSTCWLTYLIVALMKKGILPLESSLDF